MAGKAPNEEGARFANLRAWSYMQVKRMVRDRAVALLNDPLLREEAVATRYTISGQGAVQIGPKKQLRSRLGRSPDRLDAVVMGLAVGAEAATIGGSRSTLGSEPPTTLNPPTRGLFEPRRVQVEEPHESDTRRCHAANNLCRCFRARAERHRLLDNDGECPH